jgi:hypothetical protein
VPIVASDPVTYTVTAVLMNRMAVDPRGQDTATVVIAVGTGTTNLALIYTAISAVVDNDLLDVFLTA